MKKTFLLCLAGLLVAMSLSAQSFQPRLNFGAKFEPVDKVLNGAGQSDEFAFTGYTEVMGPERHPVMYMEYTTADDTPEEVREELEKYLRIFSHYPQGVALQLGLSMTRGGNGYSATVANGTHDAGLVELGRYLDSLDRKVFLRIGYEANGFWNNYNAPDYREAFRHVTDLMRAASDSIATVWCLHPITNINDMMTYYPGDDYVDWWAIDWFQPSFILNNNNARFLDSAEARQKPVMIGEATPTEIGLGAGQQSWDDWYDLVFQKIRDEPVIKAFSYINRDWAYLGGLPNWGNSKLQDDTVVACLYRQEMDKDLYQHLEPVPAQHVSTVTATADGYVYSANPTANYGQEDYLRARVRSGDTLISYVQFDLTGLPLGQVSTVQLWLMGSCDHPDNQDIEVFLAGNDWQENSLTWQNRPPLLAPLGTVNANDENKTDIYPIGLTALLQDSLAAGNRVISFAIAQPALPNVNYEFHSRELAPDYPPTLQIIHDSDALRYRGCDTTTSREAVRLLELPWQLFPNPAGDRAWLVVPPEGVTLTSLQLCNALGQPLRSWAPEALRGDRLPLSLADLPAGPYWVRVDYRHQNQAASWSQLLLRQ